jgi:putative phage-type endonuclease
MLSPQQLAARKGKLTASRVACLAKQDPKEIHQLWLEMTDQAMPEDLSAVWPVRLGEATEQLQLDWYERKNGIILQGRGSVVRHEGISWAAATLDGWDPRLACPVECKHVGGREPLEVIIERYQPQMQWQMMVTDTQQCALSVIMGANEPIIEYIPRDQEYLDALLQLAIIFMEHVRSRTPPVLFDDPLPAPIDASKIYDMLGSNQWAEQASVWLGTHNVADMAKDAEKVLKSMVPADAKKVHGYGVQVTRDRAGRLSLREIKE